MKIGDAAALHYHVALFPDSRNWRISGAMIEFVKMHGLGNDFIILDARGRNDFTVPPAAARAMADRRRGIGCDQLLIIRDSDTADIQMDILNHDGSPSGACGNGTRCVADYVMQKTEQTKLSIATDGGLLSAEYDARFGQTLVAVDMGPAHTAWQDVPLAKDCDTLAIDLGIGVPPVACHSMGNPHAVAFVDDVSSIDLNAIGPIAEMHELFPERVNFSIVEKRDDGVFRMRVWERGVGITMACGSGACAVGVAVNRRGLGGRLNEIVMDGGSVHIEWVDDGTAGGRVILVGPVAYSYAGSLSPELANMLVSAQ